MQMRPFLESVAVPTRAHAVGQAADGAAGSRCGRRNRCMAGARSRRPRPGQPPRVPPTSRRCQVGRHRQAPSLSRRWLRPRRPRGTANTSQLRFSWRVYRRLPRPHADPPATPGLSYLGQPRARSRHHLWPNTRHTGHPLAQAQLPSAGCSTGAVRSTGLVAQAHRGDAVQPGTVETTGARGETVLKAVSPYRRDANTANASLSWASQSWASSIPNRPQRSAIVAAAQVRFPIASQAATSASRAGSPNRSTMPDS